MHHLPVNLCFVFWGGTHQDIEDVFKEFSEPASQRSVHVENLDIWKVRDIIIDCIREEFSDSASSSSSSTDTVLEYSLQMPAVTNDSVHLDGLYILMCRDLTAALLQLQQQLEVGEGQNWQYHRQQHQLQISVPSSNNDNSTQSSSNEKKRKKERKKEMVE